MEFHNENGAAPKDGAATEAKNNAAQNGAAKTNAASKVANGSNGKTDAKEAKPTPAAEAATGEEPKGEAPKAQEPKKEESKPEIEQPKAEAEPVKVLTLEVKLKAVEDLHRKTVQRLSLITRMKELENFEVTLVEEGDELESNPFHGCKLIIQDDRRREFVTTTPGLIRMVSQFIFNACAEKLEAIESTINFPVA
jgi:hypothetical protein